MATQNKVSKSSHYCRDCSGETYPVPGIDEIWCLKKYPKPFCNNLSIKERNHCELCGHPDPGTDPA